MSIVVNLDVMLAKRKMSSLELAEKIGITPANLSILKQARQRLFVFQRLKQSAKSLIANQGIFLNLLRNRK